VGASASFADDFERSLARVDKALRDNPNHVFSHALEYCYDRRVFAARLYMMGETTRAERSLKSCYNVLGIPAIDPKPPKPPLTTAQIEAGKRAAAKEELDEALVLKPNIENGLEIYRNCAACHTPEGWGLASGIVPQLSGQHRKVLIKQLADIRAGNRDNRVMVPYSSVEAIGGAQAVADVAGYIQTLEISVDNGKGSGEDLELGAKIYAEKCASCHGANGEGNDALFIPGIQSQHYRYLVTQFEWIRDGKRRNANPEMVAQIKDFEEAEIHAVLDYVSRLQPPEELRAPEGWRNPDFMPPVMTSAEAPTP